MSDEIIDSNERLTTEERRKKVATFISDMLKPAQKTLDEVKTKERAIQDFESRDYQMEAWNALWQARENGADRGLIHLATGLGKTSIAVFDYAKFRKEQIDAGGNTPRALFAVHQNNILEQADERFSDLLPDVNRSFYYNNQKELPKSEITFASLKMLYNGSSRFPKDYFDYIIYDEAHHIEADTYKKVIEYFHPKFQLGMTATPERMDEKDITEHFGEALYSKSLPEALAEGCLASVKYTPIYDDAVLELIDSGFSQEKLNQLRLLLEIEPRNEEIVRKISEKQQEIRNKEGCETVKTIIFCADIEHANNIAEMMGGESYHSSKNSSEKEDTLDRFRKNGLETITVRDMFNEGVDIPDARLIIFLRTTQSKTIFEQQLGRGLRKTSDKTRVDVLDFVANIERLDMVNSLSDEVETISNRLKSRNGNYVGHNNKDNSIDVDRFEFKFSPQVVGFLKNYRYLIESRVSRVDLNTLTKEEIIQLALEKSPEAP
ncbi:MAG: DEAD/DEAH box helicase, partial [bacterium]